jgi:hypothetical protein
MLLVVHCVMRVVAIWPVSDVLHNHIKLKNIQIRNTGNWAIRTLGYTLGLSGLCRPVVTCYDSSQFHCGYIVR